MVIFEYQMSCALLNCLLLKKKFKIIFNKYMFNKVKYKSILKSLK